MQKSERIIVPIRPHHFLGIDHIPVYSGNDQPGFIQHHCRSWPVVVEGVQRMKIYKYLRRNTGGWLTECVEQFPGDPILIGASNEKKQKADRGSERLRGIGTPGKGILRRSKMGGSRNQCVIGTGGTCLREGTLRHDHADFVVRAGKFPANRKTRGVITGMIHSADFPDAAHFRKFGDFLIR